MQVLRGRGKYGTNRQSQNVARENSRQHFRVAAHVPDAKRASLSRAARHIDGLPQAHTRHAIGHQGAAVSQPPLLGL